MNQQIRIFKDAFGDCKEKNCSYCDGKSAYKLINDSIFFIVDKDLGKPVKIALHGEYFQLTVENPKGLNICLIKTDKCLITDDEKTKRCDCILFNSNKIFLIELSDSTNRQTKRKESLEQLEDTIKLLRDKNIFLTNYQKNAIVCFGGQYRITQSSVNALKPYFKERYDFILDEKRKIIFS